MPQKLHCDVTDIVHHGERVYSVFMTPRTPVPRFVPGQFLHLALDDFEPGDFWPDSRAFSIASAPAERGSLRITYAVKGVFTTRMEAELQVGRAVWVKLPYGEFTIDPHSDACVLAGGTGMTAFTAFVAGLTPDQPHDVHLFYGARVPDLLIYRPLVDEARERCPKLHAVFMAEQRSNGTDCLPGRINLNIVWASMIEPLAATYYIAGPPEMLSVFTRGLTQRGVPSRRIVIDAWE